MSAARAVGIGLALVVGMAFFLVGILVVAGLFFFRVAAPLSAPQAVVIEAESISVDPIVQPKGTIPTPGAIELELNKPGNNNADFQLTVASVSRKPDGTCVILATAQRSGSLDDLISFQVTEAEIIEPAMACNVSSPPGPPYRNPIDLAIRTPALPADLKKVRIRYVLRFESNGPPQGHQLYGNDGTLEVTLPSPLP